MAAVGGTGTSARRGPTEDRTVPLHPTGLFSSHTCHALEHWAS